MLQRIKREVELKDINCRLAEDAEQPLARVPEDKIANLRGGKAARGGDTRNLICGTER